jgi:type VI secretion system protein VasD
MRNLQLNKKSIHHFVCGITAMIVLSGCALISNNATAKLHISAAHYLNPDINGQAAPLVITIYQLKSSYRFKQANYNELSTQDTEILGADLIDKNSMAIRPGEQQNIKQIISPGTGYLGVVAAYRHMNPSHWHDSIAIDNQPGKTTSIHITLEAQTLTVKIDEKTGFRKYLWR